MRQYVLTLSEEQAECVNHALNVFSRLKIGQLDQIVWELIDFSNGNIDEMCARRDAALKIARHLESILFPDMSRDIHDEQGDIAYDIHQVLRQKIAYAHHTEGGFGYVFNDPLPITTKPLAACEVKEV